MEGTGASSSSKLLSDEVDNGKAEPCKVLVVDDNLIDRKFIEKLLNTSSFQVTAAENGMKALEYLGLGDAQTDTTEDLKVDLVLTDYCMPEITGYDLLKKIKASSHMKEVPVVVLSSEDVPERINKCLEEGAETFLLKPLRLSDVQELKNVITRFRKTV